MEVLADDQIPLPGEALEDDGQESKGNYDSPGESNSGNDPRLPVLQEIQQKTLAEKQRTDPFLSKIRQWVKSEHKPTSQEYKLLSPDEKFYVDCFEYLQLNSDGILIRQPIPYTHEKNCRIALPEVLQERVLASLHGKNHPGGNSLANAIQLKYIFPRLVSFCCESVFKCPRCQCPAKKTTQCHTYGYDLVGSPGEKICYDLVGPLKSTKKGYTSLLTVVDVYTKWFTAWPVKNQKAETVIKHLICNYVPDRGVPSVVHSDNGPAYIVHVL